MRLILTSDCRKCNFMFGLAFSCDCCSPFLSNLIYEFDFVHRREQHRTEAGGQLLFLRG